MKTLLLALALFVSPFAARAAEGETHFAVSGPLTLVDGSAFWGLNFKVGYGLTPDWTIGAGTGFFYWHKSYDVPNTSSTQWFIPIVPEAYYKIDAHLSNFHPYVGLGLGVAVIHSSVTIAGLTVSATPVKFDGMLHGGALIGPDKHFFFDIGLGLLDDSFQFAPSVGWVF